MRSSNWMLDVGTCCIRGYIQLFGLSDAWNRNELVIMVAMFTVMDVCSNTCEMDGRNSLWTGVTPGNKVTKMYCNALFQLLCCNGSLCVYMSVRVEIVLAMSMSKALGLYLAPNNRVIVLVKMITPTNNLLTHTDYPVGQGCWLINLLNFDWFLVESWAFRFHSSAQA